MRWYRSIPRTLAEATAEHGEYAREGFESRVEKATLADYDPARRASRLKRAKQRTRQLDLFGAA